MFRNRQSSQKPPDELFERFRQSFPTVRAGSTSAPSEPPEAAVAAPPAPDPILDQPRFTSHEDLDPTPRALAEPFRFTPSLTPSAFMDPTSSAFAAFANQPPGLFTPTPGPTNTSINGANPSATVPITSHDLQTSTIGISLDTPSLGLPSNATIPVTTDTFAPHTLQHHQFSNFQFNHPLPAQFLDHSQFDVRPPSGPGSPMDCSGDLSNEASMGSLAEISALPGPMPIEDKKIEQLSDLLPTSERFRFTVVLNAPTAMIKHPDEIPVTYLNKGQAYAISIADTEPPPPSSTPVKYRTYVRISFHDDTQRSRPASCWQLWKEGRGTNEAHQRGGKLQAVEYVEAALNSEEESKHRPKMELESSSFDGFVVTWTPAPGGPAEATVSVRFNFLSTDFSHSKGVKGIPVRLCAKSQIISAGTPDSATETPEVCYCKVKLFRDHGAERKLANDVLHVKKTIEKLKQQASQVDSSSMKMYGKKSKKEDDTVKPGKVQKHKRTWSVSSASSIGGTRTQEEDTNAKLQSMQDMFTSTRPISLLYLRGEEGDDPDLHPVRLPGEAGSDEIWLRRGSVATNGTNSSFVSPTPSSASLSSQRGDSFSPEKDWEKSGYKTEGPVHIKKSRSADGLLSGWIEAIGIDPSYKPPAEQPAKAVMCVYIMPIAPDQTQKTPYHRAVYLAARTASCLSGSIASKCGVDPATIYRTIYINAQGMPIIVDDDFVTQMEEGQDMKVQLQEIQGDSAFASPGWSSPAGAQTNGILGKKWELKLLY